MAMSASEATVKILCWQGYEAPSYVAEFESVHGCRVHGETFESDMQAVDRIRHDDTWDLININNPYARAVLAPENLIVPLDDEAFAGERDRMIEPFQEFFSCGWTADQSFMLGICQRFGPFNLVINSDLIGEEAAVSEGFSLADDSGHKGQFGVLDYPEFNVMHAAIACGINPFVRMSDQEQSRVASKLAKWKADAHLVTSDHLVLNEALIAGDIRFYISGGIYTAAVARMAGHLNIKAVTPDAGPIGGRGGIAFVEVTSLCRSTRSRKRAEDFVRYMLEPEQCHRIAFANGTHNPVAQMGDARVLEQFSRDELTALQWETLEDDMSKCAPYAVIPDFEKILIGA